MGSKKAVQNYSGHYYVNEIADAAIEPYTNSFRASNTENFVWHLHIAIAGNVEPDVSDARAEGICRSTQKPKGGA